MTPRNWMFVVALVVGALATGRYSKSEREPARVHEREVIRVPVGGQTGTPVAIDRDSIRDELRTVIAEQRSPVLPPSEGPTHDQERAAVQGGDLVVAAVGRRRWTASDADQLRPLLVAMTREQRIATLSSVMQAINRGEVVPDDDALF